MTRRSWFAAIAAAALCPPRFGLSQQTGGSSPPAESGELNVVNLQLALATWRTMTLEQPKLCVAPDLYFPACELLHLFRGLVRTDGYLKRGEWCLEDDTRRTEEWHYGRATVTVKAYKRRWFPGHGMTHWALGYRVTRQMIVDDPDCRAKLDRQLCRAMGDPA